MKQNKKGGIVSNLVVCLVLIAVTALIIINKQRIVDQIVVWQYQPTTEITNLATRAGMSEDGKFYYYASQPELYSKSNASSFNKICNRTEISTAILGCYNNSRIYLYNVSNAQLDGIREVTAAHETLHAIYYRLNSSEKTKVNSLVEAEYSKLKKDTEFADLMAYYERAEPGQRDNELHSLIGTEVASISSELEKYYGQYFFDRQRVVELDQKYSDVFKQLKDRADTLEKQINDLKSNISVRTEQYNNDAKTLNNDIESFNARASSDQITVNEFNSGRSALQSRITALDSMRSSINSDIQTYDNLVAEHNEIASESNKLYQSVNSGTLTPAPSM